MFLKILLLIIVLCIDISKIAAVSSISLAPIEDLGATKFQPLEIVGSFFQSGDSLVEIVCPIKKAIVTRNNCKSIHKDPIEIKNCTLRIDQWKKKLYESTEVHHWLKDGNILHRENGNPMATNKLKRVISLTMVGESDEGQYECILKYPQLDEEAYDFFDLYQSITFPVNIIESTLHDVKPSITHPPVLAWVNPGDNKTFECHKIPTMTTQLTLWFKSNCSSSPERDKCRERFREAYDRVFNEQATYLSLSPYMIHDCHSDELHLTNINDSHVEYYGCLVKNKRGMDIRLGELKLHPTPSSRDDEFAKVTSTTNKVDIDNEIHSIIADHEHVETTTTSTMFFGRDQTQTYRLSAQEYSKESNDSYPVNATKSSNPKVAASSDEIDKRGDSHSILTLILVIFIVFYIIGRSLIKKLPKYKNKAKNLVLAEPIVGVNHDEKSSTRQHLPNGDYPDIYNIGKSSDGFISGHLLHNNGQLMAQSICTRALDSDKSPSISSQSNSDEASSWAKPTPSPTDNFRTIYMHTSNSTTTTVPLYDHPPSTGTSRFCATMVKDSCVINPTYGFLRSDEDSTQWALPRRNLERLNKIGEGEFGEVWRYIARQKDGSESFVAVKQIRRRAGIGDRERLELIAEIEIMKLVNNHPNVIKILHYCDDRDPLLLIMEYAEHGKLQTYLRNCRSNRKLYSCTNSPVTTTSSKELLKFSYDIAKGMEYVASKGIIHRDLASRNILVSKEKICKVADFGFARRIDDECAYERTTTNIVPVKWMAPEALVENKFTTKSDVYSLGILMWEIVTLGATPYEYLSSREVYEKVSAGGRLDKPPHCKDDFYRIMAQCWHHDPAQRPTFKELAGQLEKLLLSENNYIELDQYPEHAYYNIINDVEKEAVNI